MSQYVKPHLIKLHMTFPWDLPSAGPQARTQVTHEGGLGAASPGRLRMVRRSRRRQGFGTPSCYPGGFSELFQPPLSITLSRNSPQGA